MSTDLSAPATRYADPAAFRAALIDAALLVPAGVEGLYHRSATFEDVVRGVEAYAAGTRTEPAAERRHLPPVFARADFVRTDYLRSFPDLAGSVEVFGGGDREHRALLAAIDAGDPWVPHLQPSAVMLSSSICHPLYGTLDAAIPGTGLLLEAAGTAFRHEPSPDPARMQSFRMYEFVRVGTPDQARAHRDLWRDRGAEALAELGLRVRVEVAHDPFFGRVGALLATSQRDAELKYEVLADLTAAGPTAIASANLHEDHFGAPFGLTTPDGSVAHSACFGYGLERIALALLATHGLDPAGWPASVRALLGV